MAGRKSPRRDSYGCLGMMLVAGLVFIVLWMPKILAGDRQTIQTAVVIVLLAAATVGALRFLKTLIGPSTPREAIVCIMHRFDTINDRRLQKIEARIARAFPRDAERDLIYALRISTSIRRITKLETLGSRWDTAHCGAGNRGLLMGNHLPDYRRVHRFLTAKYLQRFNALAEQLITEARESGKQNAVARAVQKIDDAQYRFSYPIQGLWEAVQHWKESV